jgi:hypothetical protein
MPEFLHLSSPFCYNAGMKLWLKKYGGLIVVVLVGLFCILGIMVFHVRSRDIQQALDRPLPRIKQVDPGVIEIQVKNPETKMDQSTPSDSSEATKP